MKIKEFFHSDTSTLTYLVYHEESGDAVLIDPAADYDPASSRYGFSLAETIADFLKEQQLNLQAVLETHAHADHLSAAPYFKKRFPKALLVIGSKITEVQKTFVEMYDLAAQIATDGSQFDLLMEDQQQTQFGVIGVKCLHTPGHTPSCASYLIGKAVFTGDTLFMPDFGTGRCDFPGGNAETLYHSIREVLYRLPDETEVYVGHDYQPGGRALKFKTTIGRSKAENKHLKEETTKTEFVLFRMERDRQLSAPRLLFPSIQVNINGGEIPLPAADGRRFLKIPVFES